MRNIDLSIENYQNLIDDSAEYVNYHRTVDGWVEDDDYVSRAHARYVQYQAVLFAVNEGF